MLTEVNLPDINGLSLQYDFVTDTSVSAPVYSLHGHDP